MKRETASRGVGKDLGNSEGQGEEGGGHLFFHRKLAIIKDEVDLVVLRCIRQRRRRA